MKKEKTARGKENGNIIIRIVKSAFFAAAITVALLLLYAWLLQKGILNQDSIPIANSALKILGSVIAALFSVLKRSSKRWFIGAASGLAYILLAFLVFSIAADSYSFSAGLLSDLLMGGMAGMVTGMLVQLRK